MQAQVETPRIEKNQDYHLVYDKSFAYFKDDLIRLKNVFPETGRVLHQDRNVLKEFTPKNFPDLQKNIVVKSFKEPNVLNRVVYSLFRKSKAMRSFENSSLLKKVGFSVPEPLAYIEYKQSGLLKQSFFVAEHLDFDCTLREVYRKEMFDLDVILPMVIQQGYALAQANILHKDFSVGNVLLKQTDEGFRISFVDLNRLKVGNISNREALLNFSRLVRDERTEGIIVSEFCRLSGMDKTKAHEILNSAWLKLESRKKLKNKIKGLF